MEIIRDVAISLTIQADATFKFLATSVRLRNQSSGVHHVVRCRRIALAGTRIGAVVAANGENFNLLSRSCTMPMGVTAIVDQPVDSKLKASCRPQGGIR